MIFIWEKEKQNKQVLVLKIGKLVENAKTFVIQQFIPGDTLNKEYKNLSPYSPEIISKFSENIKKYVSNILFRV